MQEWALLKNIYLYNISLLCRKIFKFVWENCKLKISLLFTGKSFSEALILASVNPQYDNRLFIELQVQYKKNTSSEHVGYKNCFECQNKNKKQYLYATCSELGIFLYWTRDSMNNLSSYYGLIDVRMSASEIDLPVLVSKFRKRLNLLFKKPN